MTSIPERGAGTVGRQRESGAWPVHFDEGGFGWWTPEVLSFLLDSPLAMCHAARWLATRLGCDPGATAPGWAQYPCGEHCCNGETGEMAACTRPVWSLGTDEGFVLFMDCPNPEAWDGEECRHVPGISDLTDPAEALAAACVAVGGAS
jgi:hypothetical protein